MDFSLRCYQKELLDGDELPKTDIIQNLRELRIINRWLGGHRVTRGGVKMLAGTRKKITICEIGCGGGDNLAVLRRWCANRNIEAFFTGIDINPDCIDFARTAIQDEHFRFIASDYRQHIFTEKPDIIFCSLFCHHFDEGQLRGMLTWMQSHAQVGFFINDLHRHACAYHGIRLLTRLFSRSYLVKNDAPLSVRRGFRRKEWVRLMQQSAVGAYRLQWKWAFRWLIVSPNDPTA